MTNYLRIALKHINNSKNKEVRRGNYHVCKIIDRDIEAILITRLNFMGKDEFKICHWLPRNNALFLYEGADEAKSEIVFIIRSLKRLGIKVSYILSSVNTDITEQFSRYLFK